MSRAFVRPTFAVCWALYMGPLLFLAAGCATDETTISVISQNEPAPLAVTPAEEAASEEEINAVIASVDDTTATDGGEDVAAQKIGDEISHAYAQNIPLELNEDVQRWIDYFSTKNRDRFQRFLERGERFRPQITAVLRDQGIPTEIYYQAMIESGFSTSATSRASAVGIWQFIKETGKRYGLRVDHHVDERRDPMRSTIAACLYMKDLYNIFNSWYLAMAAYNSGEGRIMGSIMRSKSRDFWAMAKARTLPAETMEYIPKFLAATTIGHNPKKYGFDELTTAALPQLVSVPVAAPVRLSDIADVSGISLATLKEFNPHLIRAMTPPGVATYRIWVPKDQAAMLETHQDRLATMRIKTSSVAVQEVSPTAARPAYHTVARGQTLAKIAAIYGLSVRQLKTANQLRSSQIVAGTKLLLSPTKPSVVAAISQYRVRRGDSLRSIARHFGVTIQELKRINGLRRNGVAIGQVLTVQARRS